MVIDDLSSIPFSDSRLQRAVTRQGSLPGAMKQKQQFKEPLEEISRKQDKIWKFLGTFRVSPPPIF